MVIATLTIPALAWISGPERDVVVVADSTTPTADEHQDKETSSASLPPELNQPMVVEVTAMPRAPRPGETVTFSVAVSDPDAQIERTCNVVEDYGDGYEPLQCSRVGDCLGPSLPVKRPDHFETTFTHVYDSPGYYIARFSFQSSQPCSSAYGSKGTGEVAVRVVAPQ